MLTMHWLLVSTVGGVYFQSVILFKKSYLFKIISTVQFQCTNNMKRLCTQLYAQTVTMIEVTHCCTVLYKLKM